MCKCNNNCNENVNTCGEIINSACVKYEGNIPSISSLDPECFITSEEVFEDIYNLITTPQASEYTAGDGLNLNDKEFSIDFTKVLPSDHQFSYDDLLDKPIIPEAYNLTAGSNIQIVGDYPNQVISANSDNNVIERVFAGVVELIPVQKLITIPIATTTREGLVRVGSGLSITPDGVLSTTNSGGNYTAGSGISISNNIITNTQPNVTHTGEVSGANVLTITAKAVTNQKLSDMPSATLKANITGSTGAPQDVPLSTIASMIGANTYTAGLGITLSTNNQFSVPITITGSGSSVQDVTAVAGGLLVTKANPLTMNVQGSAQLGNTNVVLVPGTNMTLSQSGNQITFNSTGGGGGSYTAGAGISIASNVITNSSPNATHTGDVIGSTSLTITNDVVSNSKLSNMPARTVKVNSNSVLSDPQDLVVEDVREFLGTQRTEVITASTSIVLDKVNHTTLFVETQTGVITIVIPDGDYDGQQINIYKSNTNIEGVEISGNLFVWETQVDQSTAPFNIYTIGEHLYWEKNKSRWIIT